MSGTFDVPDVGRAQAAAIPGSTTAVVARARTSDGRPVVAGVDVDREGAA